MGVEKLDNTVYTIRGLRDLADLAASKGDAATGGLGDRPRRGDGGRFEGAWWFGGDTHQYADSIDDPATGQRQHQELPAALDRRDPDGRRAGPPRPGDPARWRPTSTARRRWRSASEPCYSGELGLFHTGTGPTSARRRQHGPDLRQLGVHGAERARRSSRSTPAIMAVAEGNFGRLGADQQQRYTTGNARIQLDPDIWEMPGAMPEIAPEPGLRGQHRPAALRAVDGAAGLGRLRHPVAGRAPAARGQPRTWAAAAHGRAAGPRRPAPGGGREHPARWRVGRRRRRADRVDADDDGDPARQHASCSSATCCPPERWSAR